NTRNQRNREFRPETCCFRAPIPGYLRPALVNCLGNSTSQPAFMLTSGRFQARLRWIDSGVVPMRLLTPQGGNSHLVSWPQARRASAKGVLAWLINLCCCRILPSAHSRDGEMVCRASVGESAPGLGVRLNTRSGVSGACVQRKELQRCDDAENDPRVDAAACRDAEIRSILAVPILEGQELLGVLEVFASRTKAFDDTDVYAVQALSRRIVENLRRADDVGSSVDVASSVEEKSEEQRPYQEPVSPLAALSPVSEPSRREPDPVPKLTHEDQKDEQPSFVPPKLLFETESAARRDYWTTVLRWVVIVLALVLGWMVGRAGWKTAVSLFKAQTDAVSVAPETEQTNTSSKKKAPNFGIMSAPPRWVGKKKESASSNASTSDTSQAKEEAEPPFAGGLRVYQNGRVIFRTGPSVEKPTQMPVELAAQITTYEAT